MIPWFTWVSHFLLTPQTSSCSGLGGPCPGGAGLNSTRGLSPSLGIYLPFLGVYYPHSLGIYPHSLGIFLPSQGVYPHSQGVLSPSLGVLSPFPGYLAPFPGCFVPIPGCLSPFPGCLSPSLPLLTPLAGGRGSGVQDEPRVRAGSSRAFFTGIRDHSSC